jgi:hypothetical protein
MDLITGEFLDTANNNIDKKSWTKTRNYLYRTADKLTVAQVQQVLAFLRDNFSTETCQAVLQQSPRILRKKVQSFLQPTVDFLRQLYGDELLGQAVRRKPDLLLTNGMGYDADALELVELFLAKEVALTPINIKKLKRTAPFVFQLPVYKLLTVLNFFTSILKQGDRYSDQQCKSILAKLVLSHPQILQLSVTENLQPRLNFLRERCGLLETDLAVLVKGSSAAILALSVKDNLAPTIDFMSDLLRGRPDPLADLRKSLLSHPPLLGLSLDNLRSKKEYFDAIDGNKGSGVAGKCDLTVGSLASRVLVRSPAVYSLSLRGNIVPTIDFLARVWGATRQEEGSNKSVPIPHHEKKTSLAAMLSEYPGILTLSLEGNIQPTLNFFNRTNYVSLDRDWNLLPDRDGGGKPHVIRGRYIAASLFNRLLPRWQYCQSLAPGSTEKKAGDMDTTTGPPSIPLHVLVSATDPAFCQQMGIDVNAFTTFKTESIPRLRFSSQFDTWIKTGRPIDIY